MMGMLAAVEAWTTRDHAKEWQNWMTWLEQIANEVTKVKGVTTQIQEPADLNNRAPTLHIMWNPEDLRLTGPEMAEIVGRSKPRIAIGGRDSGSEATLITVTPSQMIASEVPIVAKRLREVLQQKRQPKKPMSPPISKIAGRWVVNIKFSSSESTHRWFLDQDENWISGRHESDFSTQDILGTIEAGTVKLHSVFREPGKSVPFMFHGTLEGDQLIGKIHLGEYQNATFTATREEYRAPRRNILIPDGPPLAT